MLGSRRLLDLILLVLSVVTFGLASHFWITDRLGVLRAIYPLEAFASGWQVRCSEGAPPWLRELISHALKNQHSLANQVAYQGPDGRLHHCENGWQGSLFFSPKVTMKTRFRFASLSKLLTADAVIARVNADMLSLDDRLLDHLVVIPQLVDARIARITLDQLLRHRGGTDRLRRPDPMLINDQKPWCPGNIAELSRLELDFDPGERAVYANLGYCLLGVVLERASGKPYRELMEEQYGLASKGLRFVDGPYLADEIRYDFRNSNLHTENYFRRFDFKALSSSAGLSGNAVGLATILADMPKRKPLNLLSSLSEIECDIARYKSCYGYAVTHYQPDGAPLKIYTQSGLLIGAASQAVFDSHGGVTVWLGNGMTSRPGEASKAFSDLLVRLLAEYYQLNGESQLAYR